MNKYKKEAITSVMLVVIALITYFWLIPTYIQESGGSALSPQFFPKIGALLIGFFGVLMLLVSFYGMQKSSAVTADLAQAGSTTFTIKTVYVVLVFMVFIYLFERVGYVLNAPAMICALMLIFGQRNLKTLIGVSILVPALLFVVFNYGLNLPLRWGWE